MWYGWLDVLQQDGHCGHVDSTQYGIHMQLALGVLFYVSLTFVQELYYLPARIYEHCYEKKAGLTDATNCQFFCFQLIAYLQKLFMELPILILAVVLLTVTKKWFCAAVLGATVLVNLALIYIFPKCCMRCESAYLDLPEEQKLLKMQIEELCKRVGYPSDRIGLMQARSGDLHSNAVTTQSSVRLSEELLEHHKDHNEEILAIVAHELGHWKKSHITKMVAINTVYMGIFGLFMIPCIDNEQFLAAFNIQMESYFMTMVLFVLLYQRSIDIPIRMFILWFERKNEYEADHYSVEMGFGKEATTALIRNFSKNKEIIFTSGLSNFIESSHPPFLSRLERINSLTKEIGGDIKPAPELSLKEPNEVSSDSTPPPLGEPVV